VLDREDVDVAAPGGQRRSDAASRNDSIGPSRSVNVSAAHSVGPGQRDAGPAGAAADIGDAQALATLETGAHLREAGASHSVASRLTKAGRSKPARPSWKSVPYAAYATPPPVR
jgi:hypothetical protein